MKNLKIQKIQNIQNIQNINPNLNIPVGQIVLINVNKNRESLVHQEPLDQVENELKDVDQLTKTKNTFTHSEKVNGIKCKKQAPTQPYRSESNEKRIQNSNLYQTPKVIDTKYETKNSTQQHQTNCQTNQNSQQVYNNQAHSQVNKQLPNLEKTQLIDRTGQQLIKQSTISLNHHYEQPDLLLSKVSIIRSNDKKNNNTSYDTVDGVMNIANQRTTTTTNTPHYEKPITIKRCNANLSSNGTTNINNQLLDDVEINQIESFYRSQRTYVFASRSMANLYFTQTDLCDNGRYSSPRAHEWTLSRTGVPLIIFNRGETKCRSKRQLRFALAERGSGFQLFSDVIDNLTDYKKMHDSFHTFYLSCDHRKMAGLSFDCATSADEFLRQIELITSNPKNISLTGPKFYSKKSLMNSKNQLNKCKNSLKKSTKKYKKSDISMPCLFQHITNLDINDFEKFYSLSTLVVRALNPNYQKCIEESQESDNLSSNLSKLSIENLSNNSTKCDSSGKQIYKQYIHSSICSYSSSSSPTLPGSSCSYTSSNEDHS